MEEQSKREDRILKNLIGEAGTERPSLSFDDDVMRSIEGSNASIPEYKPLITRRAWLLIGLGFIAVLAAVLLMGPGEPGVLRNLLGDSSISLPRIDWSVSRSFIYAVAFMGLFLLQIPILKKQFIDRR